jgi:nucleotide-binding universal stress UspA family protein
LRAGRILDSRDRPVTQDRIDRRADSCDDRGLLHVTILGRALAVYGRRGKVPEPRGQTQSCARGWEQGMGYAAILVHVDADADSDPRVKLARELAARCEARLIGAAAWAPESVAAGDIAGEEQGGDGADFVGGEEIDKPQVDEISAWLGRLGEHFRSSVSDKRAEWRAAVDFPSDFVVRQARAADLLIVGPDRTGDSYRSLDPGTVLINAGRPVLLVPTGVGSMEARRILIAWKNTREARRAVRDALPLLRQAEEVLAVHVTEAAWRSDTDSDLEDAADYLARHDVRIRSRTEPHSKSGVAAELVRSAKQQGADLIVAGGYGRSRLGEAVFGGVTRELLMKSPICCLFSH